MGSARLFVGPLGWSLKAWWVLTLPEQPGRWHDKHQTEKRWVLRLEFKAFVNAFEAVCQKRCQFIFRGDYELTPRPPSASRVPFAAKTSRG
jgi:hypothetical protein